MYVCMYASWFYYRKLFPRKAVPKWRDEDTIGRVTKRETWQVGFKLHTYI